MEFLPYRLEKMTESLIERARKELGESEEVRQRCLAEVRKFIEDQKNLVGAEDEIFLLSFIRKGKFDQKRAITLLQAYFREKKNFPDIFSLPKHDQLIRCYELNMAQIMSYRDKDGCVIIVFRAENWDPNEFKFATLVHFIAVSVLASVEYEATQVCGVKVIFSIKGLSLSHLKHMHFRYIVLLARGVRYCLPVRVKGIHFVNENAHLQFIWNLVSFTVGPKIRSRVHFHGTDHESLHEFIDPAVLPTDLGGKLNKDSSFSIEELQNMKDVYLKRLNAGYH